MPNSGPNHPNNTAISSRAVATPTKTTTPAKRSKTQSPKGADQAQTAKAAGAD
jgi:hypothetical protein